MKFILLAAALVTCCTGSAIPSIPIDNSHYVEGESRYIWMAGKDGEPVLVDLHEPVNENALTRTKNNPELNLYLLYTRQNPTDPQMIIYGDASSVWNSNYIATLPLKVIIHGWNNNFNSDVNILVRQAFLDDGNYNVIVVDWSHLASHWNYLTSAAGVPDIGNHVGQFIQWLFSIAGGNWSLTHIVGHSLGAHAAGNAGRATGNRVMKITGLDPAGPIWGGNSNALNPDDATYVEVIHTDGGLLGIFDRSGDADFYPNGGRNFQPGCVTSLCSHGRAYEYFAATVRYGHLYGTECANLWDAQNVNCPGAALQMGTSNLWKRGYGIFGLVTGRTYPF